MPYFIKKNLDWLHFEFAVLGIDRESTGKAIGANVSCSFRGYDISLYPHQYPNCYDILFKSVDKIHTISNDLYLQSLELGLNPLIDYQKITPAINTSLFKSSKSNDIISKPLKILTVGRLHWKKGYDYALDALKLILDSGLDFEYNIIGDGDYFEGISYSIHSLNLTKNVQLLGVKSQKEVIKQMEWADIYIQPSIQEGFCNSVLRGPNNRLISHCFRR